VRPTLEETEAPSRRSKLRRGQLFKGQSDRFFSKVMKLAKAADAAEREV